MDPPGDAGPERERTLPFTELPPERLAMTCREIVGAAWVSLDPADPAHWRAQADNVLLRSADEGRTWTRSPIDTGLAATNLFIGPVILSFASTDPHVADAGLRISVDRGDTWAAPRFEPANDTTLAPGTVVATIADTRIAWSPSRVVRISKGGEPWRSEANTEQGALGDDVHATLGAREWVLDAKEKRLFRSRDGGRTFERLPFEPFRFIELLGERGVVAARQPNEGLWISQDDGDTWTRRTGLTSLFAVGPDDGEVWAVTATTGAERPRLMRSRDSGASFAPVTVSLGAAGEGVAIEPGTNRVHAMADGRRVFVPRLETPLGRSNRMVCIESPTGALEQVEPSKSDVRGSATLWAPGRFGFALGTRQQVVPLAEPGRAFAITSRTFPEVVAITGGTRLPDGAVALLLKPRPVIDPSAGPPMIVQLLDPQTLEPTRRLTFTSLVEATPTRATRYLESRRLQALPDGGLRTDTAEGDYPIGVDPAVWVPWPSEGRWGRGGAGAQLVTFEQVEATHLFRLSSDFTEAAVFCSRDAQPSSRCLRYEGQVQDWGVRDSRLYVLDAWRGEVLEGTFGVNEPLRPVLTGLAAATSLFVPVDRDPGVYVVDFHLYRFVPGTTAARRP